MWCPMFCRCASTSANDLVDRFPCWKARILWPLSLIALRFQQQNTYFSIEWPWKCVNKQPLPIHLASVFMFKLRKCLFYVEKNHFFHLFTTFFITLKCKCKNSSYETTRDSLQTEMNSSTPNREHRRRCLDVKRSRCTANRHRIFGSNRVFCYRTHAGREASMLVFTCETDLLCVCLNCVVFVALKRTTRHRLANREFVNKSHAVEPQIRQVPFQMRDLVYRRLFSPIEFRYSQLSLCLQTEIFALFVVEVDWHGFLWLKLNAKRNLRFFAK